MTLDGVSVSCFRSPAQPGERGLAGTRDHSALALQGRKVEVMMAAKVLQEWGLVLVMLNTHHSHQQKWAMLDALGKPDP